MHLLVPASVMGENTIFMRAHMGWDGSTQIRSCCAACEYYLGKTCKHMLVALNSSRNVHCDKAWWGLFSGPHENRFLAAYPAAGRVPYATLEEAQAASLNNVAAGGLTREWNGHYTVRMGTTLQSSSTGEASWVKLQDWTMCKHAFSFTGARFLEALPRTWNIRSQGGLTIVAEIKFLEAGWNETVIDFGSTLERHYDSFLLSRWQKTDQLYAVITHKVCSCHLRHCLHLIRFPVS